MEGHLIAAWSEKKESNHKRSNDYRKRLSGARSIFSKQVLDGDGLRGWRLTLGIIPTHAAAAYVQNFQTGPRRANSHGKQTWSHLAAKRQRAEQI